MSVLQDAEFYLNEFDNNRMVILQHFQLSIQVIPRAFDSTGSQPPERCFISLLTSLDIIFKGEASSWSNLCNQRKI